MSISFAPGATSKSIDIKVYDDDGLPVTGLVAATMPTVKYSLAGANADATISLTDLATIGTAWSSGGLKERGEGVYRLDLPNAALTTAGIVTVRGEATGKRVVCEPIEVIAAAPTAAAIAAEVATGYPANFAALSINAFGQVTVGGYAIGEAPLTAAETRTALGMAAADLDTQLDAISAKTDLIGVGNITTVSIVGQHGDIEIVRGDDYSNSDSRAIDWTDADDTWPTLTSATVTAYFGKAVGGTVVFSKSGSVVTATGTGKKVRLELTAAETAALSLRSYSLAVVATLSSGRIVTLVQATATVKSRQDGSDDNG